MRNYMQIMASVIDGSYQGALQDVSLKYFDAKYVSVYRNNSVSAHIDVLRANYKSVAVLVGEEFFTSICLEYIKAYPATRRTLVGYGEHFAHMIDDNVEHHGLPYLSSFVKLDRAWTLAHTAQDVDPLTMSVLENIIAQGRDIESYRLALVPGATLVRNDWPVFPIWAALREDRKLTDAVNLKKQAETVLVWRNAYTVMFRDLGLGEVTFLNAVRNGENLGVATALTLSKSPDVDIGQYLSGMMAANIFTKYKKTKKHKGGAHA